MSEQLAWVYRGPLAGHDLIWMDADDLEQAIRDDWAQPVVGTGTGMFPESALHAIEAGPHEAAEAYAARNRHGEGGYRTTREGGYPTREMVAGKPSSPAPPEKVDSDGDDDEEDKPATKAKKQPAKR